MLGRTGKALRVAAFLSLGHLAITVTSQAQSSSAAEERLDAAVEAVAAAPAHPARQRMIELDEEVAWEEGEHLFGDWGGLRGSLEEVGINYDLVYIFDLVQPLAGGGGKRVTPLGWLEFGLAFDLDTVLGLEGGTLFAGLLAQHGRSPSVDTLDFQLVSNIDVDDTVVLYELWYEQVIGEGLLRIKVGKVDFNTEFAYLDAAGAVMNTSASFSPTIPLGPSTPDSAMSLNVFLQPTDWLQIGCGLYDSDHDDLVPGTRTLHAEFHEIFLIAELALSWDRGWGRGRAGVGVWHHTGDFEAYSGDVEDGATGFYLVVEQSLWREAPENPADTQALVLFLQYGHADADLFEVEHHLAGGLIWQGFIPGRDDDISGLYLSWVDLVDDAGHAEDELAIELFHRFQLTPFLALQPDLQYIVDAGGESGDAVAISLRIEVVF